MLFPTEDQSKLDKRSLINLPIPLGWEQLCSCSLQLSKQGSWCIDVMWLVGRAPASPIRTRDQDPGILVAAVPRVSPAPVLFQEEGKHLIRQTKQSASLALRKWRGEDCKGYADAAASALFNFLLRMVGGSGAPPRLKSSPWGAGTAIKVSQCRPRLWGQHPPPSPRGCRALQESGSLGMGRLRRRETGAFSPLGIRYSPYI